MSDQKKVIYKAPPAKVIDECAKAACEKLGQEYTRREVQEGFAHFAKTVLRIAASQKNRKGG